ncbi:MAG: hypothetical protein IKZ61_11910 [Prevotella sp.]|nr:hypothetical protein [Prevotella sp.]
MRYYTRRNLMMEDSKVKPYIQDGLVFHLDGADSDGKTWVDRVAGIIYTRSEGTADGKGVTFNMGAGAYMVGNKSIATISPNAGTIEVCAYRRGTTNSVTDEVLYATSGMPAIHYDVDKSGTFVTISNRNSGPAPRAPISGKGVGKFTHSCCAARTCYNGTMAAVGSQTYKTQQANRVGISFKGDIYQIRIYNRQLTEAEMRWNQIQDAKRYGIALEL